jgi:DNA replication and repair protein RecF
MTAPVYLETLDLTDFRNYAAVQLALGEGRFIAAGDNAQGKSNLCEAIRLLATMRSFRAGTDRELVRWGSAGHFARILADVARADGPLRLEIIISAPPTPDDPLANAAGLWSDNSAASPLSIEDGEGLGVGPPPARLAAGKRIKVNGAPRRPMDCVGLVTVVLFEPADLDLVGGPPSGRRHFMDVTLCQISRSYCRALSQYQRVLTQRSALLRRIRENQDDPRALDYWDTQLAQQAVPLITERAGLITRCLPTADQVALRLGGRGLRLVYQPSFAVDAELPTATAVAAFLEKLKSLRKREIAQGVNLLGPHRDDLAFLEGPINLATYGSRGQQRGAALALKLAELEAIELETGDQPILVLDDVLSELDPTRRTALLDGIGTISQVILTTAEPEAVPAAFAASARWLPVRAGAIGA